MSTGSLSAGSTPEPGQRVAATETRRAVPAARGWGARLARLTPKPIRRLLRLPETFGARQFTARERYRHDYEVLASSLLRRLEFASVADVGCANGFLLEVFLAAGRRVHGVELSPEVLDCVSESLRPWIRIGDFTELEGRWDLVCCVEVAEHIPRARSRALVDVVTGAARKAVYFTAAPPGQSGRGHINCRPYEEWLAMFRDRGWTLDPAASEAVRRDLESVREAVWLASNGRVLRPRAAL